MAHILDGDTIDWSAYERESEAQTKVLPASAFIDDAVRIFYPPAGKPIPGLPFNKSGDKMLFRPEEVTVWAGISGHGKSALLGQVVIALIAAGHKAMIASFEMKPGKTLGRMCRQASQGSQPSESFIRSFGKWTDGLLWLYDQQGTVYPERMTGVIRYAAEQLGCQHIVIDSLMKVVRKEDDYNAQKEFIDRLCELARDLRIHIHVVHHIRKGENEDRIPGKFDAKGSGSITDQVDNFLLVWRNKRKERDVSEGKANDDPDVLLCCDKQRNGDWEGRLGLWFHAASTQYCETSACYTRELTA